jgi:hypothetical protein
LRCCGQQARPTLSLFKINTLRNWRAYGSLKNHHDQSGGIWEFMRPTIARIEAAKPELQMLCFDTSCSEQFQSSKTIVGGPVICGDSMNFTLVLVSFIDLMNSLSQTRRQSSTNVSAIAAFINWLGLYWPPL